MASSPSRLRSGRPSRPSLHCVVYEHDDCKGHNTRSDGVEHQEAPMRLDAIRERLARMPGVVFTSEFKPATDEQLLRVHSSAYLDALKDVERDFQVGKLLSPEPLSPHVVTRLFPTMPAHGMTLVSVGSMSAARRAAGAVIAAVDGVLTARQNDDDSSATPHAFCLVRPPGHHACVDGFDPVAGGCGFCHVNNVAVGAAHAVSVHGRRVAIVDFDVHHGNGTENIVAARLARIPRAQGPLPTQSAALFSSDVPVSEADVEEEEQTVHAATLPESISQEGQEACQPQHNAPEGCLSQQIYDASAASKLVKTAAENESEESLQATGTEAAIALLQGSPPLLEQASGAASDVVVEPSVEVEPVGTKIHASVCDEEHVDSSLFFLSPNPAAGSSASGCKRSGVVRAGAEPQETSFGSSRCDVLTDGGIESNIQADTFEGPTSAAAAELINAHASSHRMDDINEPATESVNPVENAAKLATSPTRKRQRDEEVLMENQHATKANQGPRLAIDMHDESKQPTAAHAFGDSRSELESSVLFCSTHLYEHFPENPDYDFFPGRGGPDGKYDDNARFSSAGGDTSAAFSNVDANICASVLNLPLEPLWVRTSRHSLGGKGSSSEPALRGRHGFRSAVTEKLLPRLRTFAPDLLLISAGFDGAAGDDGNAQDDVEGLDLTDEDFRWVTTRLCAAVGSKCPVVSVLEGGYGTWDAKAQTYDRSTLASGCAAHVSALCAHVRTLNR